MKGMPEGCSIALFAPDT